MVEHVWADQISANDGKGRARLQGVDDRDDALQGSARIEVAQRAPSHDVRIRKMHKTKIRLRRRLYHRPTPLLAASDKTLGWLNSMRCTKRRQLLRCTYFTVLGARHA